jgi:hypothetical protein
MRFCGRCGAQASEQATYCPKCGNALAKPVSSRSTADLSSPSAAAEEATTTVVAAPTAPQDSQPRHAPLPPAPRRPIPPVAQAGSTSHRGFESETTTSRRGEMPIRTIVAVVVVLAALGAGAVLLFGGGANRSSPSTHRASASRPVAGSPGAGGAPASTPTATGPSSAAPAAPIAPAALGPERAAVVAVLGEYQTAYSNHDGAGVSRLLTPGVVRHGLTAQGCRYSRGRTAVLSAYESQFAAGSGAYRLIGLTASDVQLRSASAAHVNSRYDIAPGGSGNVSFTLARESNEWKITQIYATCA